jgi:hypothetical protein
LSGYHQNGYDTRKPIACRDPGVAWPAYVDRAFVYIRIRRGRICAARDEGDEKREHYLPAQWLVHGHPHPSFAALGKLIDFSPLLTVR